MVMPSGALNTTGCEKPSEQVQVLARHRGAVTDADQLELALEAFATRLHHVGRGWRGGYRSAGPASALAASSGIAVFDA